MYNGQACPMFRILRLRGSHARIIDLRTQVFGGRRDGRMAESTENKRSRTRSGSSEGISRLGGWV